jgi:hypothetical protein
VIAATPRLPSSQGKRASQDPPALAPGRLHSFATGVVEPDADASCVANAIARRDAAEE